MVTAETKKKIAFAVIAAGVIIGVLFGVSSFTRGRTTLVVARFHDSELQLYNGCYQSRASSDNVYGRRTFYKLNHTGADIKFAYCKEYEYWKLLSFVDQKEVYLERMRETGGFAHFRDNEFVYYDEESDSFYPSTVDHSLGACGYRDQTILKSEYTDAIDISAVLKTTWYERRGSEVNVDLLQLNKGDEGICSLLGDGLCHDNLNTIQYEYDLNDCCSTACGGGTDCAAWKEDITVFDTNTNGISFSSCIDPSMKEVTIRLDEFSSSYETNNLDVFYPSRNDFFDPFFDESKKVQSSKIDIQCNGRQFLAVDIDGTMSGKVQIIRIPDGAHCDVLVTHPIQNKLCTTDCHQTEDPFWVFRYTIYEGVGTDDSKMMLSRIKSSSFWRIPESMMDFAKSDSLGDSITNVYANETAMNVFRWMIGESESPDCDDSFARRFYLVAFLEGFENGMDVLQSLPNHVYRNGTCNEGNPFELRLSSIPKLSGSIPKTIGMLQHIDNLYAIDLKFNDITGSIPTEIGQLSQLTSIDFKYMGRVPSEMGDYLEWLEWIEVGNGQIPSEIGHLTNLKYLHLTGYYLIGTIPTEIFNLNELVVLDVESNELSGPFPKGVVKMDGLQGINLSGNHFTGSIPSEVAKMTDLQRFYVGINDLTGTIPTELGKMTSLQRVSMGYNDLTGPVPTEVGNLSDLRFLKISDTKLKSTIPTEIGKLSQLRRLTLDSNEGLHGSLPEEIAQCAGLFCIELDGANITIGEDLYETISPTVTVVGFSEGAYSCDYQTSENDDFFFYFRTFDGE